MNRLSIVALLTLALGCASGGTASTEADVLARVAAFANAFEEADVATLSSMLTDDYVHTNSGAPSIGRERWLQYIATRKQQLDSGALTLTRYENRDLAVRLRGDAAVVTGVNVSEGKRGGEQFSTRLRFTQLWVRTADGWKRAAFHDAAATE